MLIIRNTYRTLIELFFPWLPKIRYAKLVVYGELKRVNPETGEYHMALKTKLIGDKLAKKSVESCLAQLGEQDKK